jgi:hypothetical protein
MMTWEQFWQPGVTVFFYDNNFAANHPASYVGPPVDLTTGATMNNSGGYFSSTDEAAIEAAFKEVFDNDPAMANQFWSAITPSTPLIILHAGAGTTPEGAEGQNADGNYYISLNLDTSLAQPGDAVQTNTIFEWNKTGSLKALQLPLVVAHEMFHATDTADPAETPDLTDYTSAASTANLRDPHVVVDTNAVAVSLGLSDYQTVSYHSDLTYADPRSADFVSDFSYSNGNPIDTVWIAPQATFLGFGLPFTGSNNLDMSTRTDNVLAFGLDGNDIIKTGAGNDYIYGGNGNDTISAGSGNNFIDGGQPRFTLPDGVVDTADYTAAPSGITVNLTPSNPSGSPSIFNTGTISVENGYGGADTLTSIEHIIGSDSGNNTVVATSVLLDSYALTPTPTPIDDITVPYGVSTTPVKELLIDGGAVGTNTIDFSGLTDPGVDLTANGTTLMASVAGAGPNPNEALLFTNFTAIDGPNSSSVQNIFDLTGLSPSIQITINAGNADNTFTGNGNSLFIGGSGDDTFLFKGTPSDSAGDFFDGGSGGENDIDLSLAPATAGPAYTLGFGWGTGYNVNIATGQIITGGTVVAEFANVKYVIGSNYDDTFSMVAPSGEDVDGGGGYNTANYSSIYGNIQIDPVVNGPSTSETVTNTTNGAVDYLTNINSVTNVGRLDIASSDFSGTTPPTTGGLSVDGTGGAVLSYAGSGEQIAFAATTDAAGNACETITQGGNWSPIDFRNFATTRIDGSNNVVQMTGNAIPASLQLAGSGNTADYSSSAAGTTNSVQVGAGDTVIAGASALNISSLDAGSIEGTLVLPETWANYAITLTGANTYAITAKDGSAGIYTAAGIANFQFADGTLQADQLLNVAPTGLSVANVANTEEVNSYGYSGLLSPTIGTLTAADPNTLDHISYSIASASSAYFEVNGSNLVAKALPYLDYTYWHTTVETAFGGGLSDAQLQEKFASGTLSPSDAAAEAYLHTAFLGTPYMATVTATDAGGLAISNDVFLDLTYVNQVMVYTVPSDQSETINTSGGFIYVGDHSGLDLYGNGTIVYPTDYDSYGQSFNHQNVSVQGDGNNIWVRDYSIVDVTGNGDIVGIQGGNASIDVIGTGARVSTTGTGSSITVSGDSAEIFVGSQSAIVAIGNNDIIGVSSSTIEVSGTGERISGASNSINLEANGFVAIIGNNNDLVIGAGGGASFFGDGNTVAARDVTTLVFTGDNNSAVVGNANSVSITGNNDTLTAGSGGQFTFSGDHDSISVGDGVSLQATLTNSTVSFGSNFTSGNISGIGSTFEGGNSDSLTVGPGSYTFGANATLYVAASGGETDLTVGVQSTITLIGSNTTLRLTGQGFNLTNAAVSASIYLPQHLADYAIEKVGSQFILSAPGLPNEVINDYGSATYHFQDYALSNAQLAVYIASGVVPETTINSAPTTVNLTADASFPASGESASGNITFTDPGLSDVHTAAVSLLSDPSGIISQGSLIATVVADTTGSGMGGEIAWNYAINDASLSSLQDGQTVTGNYTITVNDGHGGTAFQDVDVTISRSADQTAIVSGGATGSLSNVANDSAIESTSGLLAFTDGDKLDSHAVAAPVFISSDGGTTSIGSLQASLSADTTSTGSGGQVAWTYNAGDAALYALAKNQTVHETWQVSVSDGHGGTTTQNVVISLTGPADHAPVITSASPALTVAELPNTTGSTVLDHAQASIVFTDVDPGDLPTATLGGISAVYTDAHGNVQTLSAGELASLEAGLSIAQAAGNANNGSAILTYSTPDSSLDFLGQGETVVLSANVTVDDHHGGTASTPVSVTINGAEDAPITTPFVLPTVSQSSAVVTVANPLANASDPDIHSTLSLVAGSETVTASDGTMVAVTTQNGAITIDPSQFAYLGAGEQATLTIGYGVTDGTTTTEGAGTMIVTGVNDAPTITAANQNETAAISELPNVTGSTALDSQTGVIQFADIDRDDRLTASVTAQSIVYRGASGTTYTLTSAQIAAFTAAFTLSAAAGNTNTGQVNWTYAIADDNLDFMGAGETVTVTSTVTINDQHGGTSPAIVTVTITGTNDAPVATTITSPATTDRSAPVAVNLLSTASDPDMHDTLSVVPGSLVLTSSDGHSVAGSLNGNLLTINPAQFQYLGAGQSITLTYGFNVTDGTAVVADTGSLVVSYAADHAPTISAINAGSVTQNAAIQQINLLAGAADADASDIVSVVPASLVLTASDHHAVVGTLVNGVLSINPSQFNYLHAGQSDTITAAYNITDGTDVVANTATLVVTGLNDAPVVPNTTLNPIFQSGSVSFLATTGVTDPDTGATTSLVAGSETATSSDGHSVVVTDSGGDINLAGSQFKYLADDQVTTVTINFKVASSLTGAPQGQGTLVETVVGLNDLPTATATTTINQSDTSSYTIFPEETGYLLATPVDANGVPIAYSIGSGSTTFPTLLATDNNGFYTVNVKGEYIYIPNSMKINGNTSGTLSDNITAVAGETVGEIVGSTITMNYTGAYEAPTNITWSAGGYLNQNNTYSNGFDLGTLTDFDIDNQSKTWTLVNNDGGAFAITSAGHITVANNSLIGYASNPSGFNIVVKETDSDGLYVQQTVHIGWGSSGSGGGGSTFTGSPNEQITAMTTGVFDYSGSTSGIFINYLGPAFGYTGYGGSADGDTVMTGDNQNQTSATSYTFNLPSYNSIIKLGYWTTVTVNASSGDDTVIGDDTHFSATYHTVYDINGGTGFDTIHPGNDGYDNISFGSGGGELDYAGIQSTYVVFNWADAGGTSAVHLYNTAGSSVVDAGITDVTGSFSTFNGTPSADTIVGNNQNNTINGGGGYDTITDGNGNDTITAYGGVIHVGSGNDTIILNTEIGITSSLRSEVYAGSGNDTITMLANGNPNVDIYAGTGNDTIDATWGSTGTVIYGAAGNDILTGNSAVTVSYADATGPIAINGETGTLGAALGNLILGVPGNGNPKIQGSNYGDTFVNTAYELHLGTGNNTVINSTGNVYGGTGNDTIEAAANTTIHTGGGLDVVNSAPNSSAQIYFDHPTGVTSAAQLNYGYGDGTDNIYTFLQGSDSVNISRLAGYVDPVVSISQSSGNTDVHMTWYVTTPVQGQPLPSHVDADIFLHGVLLTTFTQNHDYHVV